MTPQEEMKQLVDKWKGKNPPFMSQEYIDMRIDRIRYIRLVKQYGKLGQNRGKEDIRPEKHMVVDLEAAKEAFGDLLQVDVQQNK